MSALQEVNAPAALAASPIPFVAPLRGERAPGSLVGAGGDVGAGAPSGVDTEGVIGLDHGALRIRPLVEPGWGRSAATWGPYTSRCGLTAAVLVLNGHNASENVDPWPSLRRFLLQWSRGTQVDAVLARWWAYRNYGGREGLVRRLRSVRANHRAVAAGTTQEENLAVGLFGTAAPSDALGGGAGFVVRSTGPTNGTLCVGSHRTPVLEGVQNVPMHLLVIQRDHGVLYAAATLAGVPGLPSGPQIRPLCIDPAPSPDEVWVGVHQAVLGQVGWGVDTRVNDVRVACPPAFGSWYTTAHAAARRPLSDGRDELDRAWQDHRLTPQHPLRLLTPPQPTGLVHVTARVDGAEQRVGVALRVEVTRGDGWLVTASTNGVVAERFAHRERVERWSHDGGLALARDASLQIIDDGMVLKVVLDGRLVLGPLPVGGAAPSEGPAAGLGVGVRVFDELEAGGLRDFEAHPCAVELPVELRPDPLPVPCGELDVYDEDFGIAEGAVAATLAGRHVGGSVGGPLWEHSVGATPFTLDGHGALVVPVAAPPGGVRGKLGALVRSEEHRNIFTVPWPDPNLADATISLVAPGSARGLGERGRGGLVFRQDADHQLIVNTWLDDEYEGTSVSSFLRIGGFEDVYDAVWTNVGRRITWGQPYRLRVAFDGETFVVYVGAEPVLYRRITDMVPSAPRLRIERVGIVSNWEFGDDTGTRFVRFQARAAHHSSAAHPLDSPCSTSDTAISTAKERLS